MMAGNFQRSISDFAKQKAESLSSVDHSKKGTVDAAICDLVGFINASDNFFTTSSCSGRIAVIAEVRNLQSFPHIRYHLQVGRIFVWTQIQISDSDCFYLKKARPNLASITIKRLDLASEHKYSTHKIAIC